MNAHAERRAGLLSPLTLSERVAVGEEFFRRCCSVGLTITMLLAVAAGILALLNADTPPTGTIVIAALAAFAARAGQRPTGYDRLRRYPYVLVLGGPVTALSSLWPTVDANALYFPALAPLALIACVAQRRRERIAVIVSVAIGTFLAALLDTRSPHLGSPEELAGATVGVAYLGFLLGVVVDWCARKVLLAPDDLDVDAPPGSILAIAPQGAAEEHRRLERVGAISQASSEDLERARTESLASLTARELQVLFLVGEGLDRADIADHLCITPKTVDKHVQHVREKSGLTGSGRPTTWLTLQLPPFKPHPPDRTST